MDTVKRTVFEHDCEFCNYLGPYDGSIAGDTLIYDLYVCGDENQTLVARYGNDGAAYISGMPFVGKISAITEAHKRARLIGVA